MIEKCNSEKDPQIDIQLENFIVEAGSTILVRECVRGTKLEGSFRKKQGQSDTAIGKYPDSSAKLRKRSHGLKERCSNHS